MLLRGRCRLTIRKRMEAEEEVEELSAHALLLPSVVSNVGPQATCPPLEAQQRIETSLRTAYIRHSKASDLSPVVAGAVEATRTVRMMTAPTKVATAKASRSEQHRRRSCSSAEEVMETVMAAVAMAAPYSESLPTYAARKARCSKP